MARQPYSMISFSDAGAHIRNMAFYKLGLRFLKLVQKSNQSGRTLMPIEKAIWRLTGEQADWYGIGAGKLRIGGRVDVVVLNPAAFDQDLDAVVWAEMQNFDLQHLVNRNPGLIERVSILGRTATVMARPRLSWAKPRVSDSSFRPAWQSPPRQKQDRALAANTK